MKLRALLLSVLAVSLTAACATTPTTNLAGGVEALPASATSPAAELRLGYFANVTHATAVHGVGSGAFQEALGDTALTTQAFNAGPAAVESLFAGSLDAAYLGPTPAVNAFVKSRGEAVRVVAGATSGGASLVAAPGIDDAQDLRGKVVASPQTGGTQDVALRTWLAREGLPVDLRGGGPVTVRAQDNGQTLQEFRTGRIAAAWVPEPWASRLVLEAGGRVLVDEADLWPDGRFVTTQLVVRTAFLREHPQTVAALLRGQVAAREAFEADPAAAKQVLNAELEELTGQPLSPEVLDRALAGIELTEDPLAATLRTSAEHAFATGLLAEADLRGLYDLSLLRSVLGRDVDDDGLGSAPLVAPTLLAEGLR